MSHNPDDIRLPEMPLPPELPPDEGDEIVFSPKHNCSAAPKPPLDPPRLIPSWVFTVPTEDPAEPRYMETLDTDERGGH